jgi:hypothetical protein
MAMALILRMTQSCLAGRNPAPEVVMEFLKLSLILGSILALGCAEIAPVRLTFRESKLDSDGFVLQVHNTGDDHLACRMEAENEEKGQTTSHRFTLEPYEDIEIGILEIGWTFVHDEKVEVSCKDRMTVRAVVP